MGKTGRWVLPLALTAFSLAAGIVLLVRAVPRKDGVTDWYGPLAAGGWMAWTLPTALFFLVIAGLLALMAVREIASPGGGPRVGILRFETTRGDRLFISLLGSAFIQLAWLGLDGSSLWWALGLCVIYAIGVFRLV